MAAGISVALLEGVCSNAVESPTWLTRPILDAVGQLANPLPSLERWRALWLEQETARRLHHDVAPHFRSSGPMTRTGIMSDPRFADLDRGPPASSEPPTSSPFWFQSDDLAWLVLVEPDVFGRWVVCLPEDAVSREVDAVLRRANSVPPYFGWGVLLGSRPYRGSFAPGRENGRWQPSMISRPESTDLPPARPLDAPFAGLPLAGEAIALGSQAATHPVLGALRVDLYLDHPSLLFAHQRTRRYWFAALLMLSGAAALAGLLSAWRAFHRQEILAALQSRFVSSVSHELRAPIASIRLLAEGLEQGRIRAPGKQAEYFGLMGQQCRRLTALIENILDFSRIDQGRTQYEFESTDIPALVRQTVRLMEPQAAEHQVTLVIRLSPQPSNPGTPLQPDSSLESTGTTTPDDSFRCLDGRALQQALVNLIDNAIKHAPPGSAVEVGLAFGPFDQPGAADETPPAALPGAPLRLWVRDSGEGIPASEQEKIFEPFYRRGTELRRETTGIGIGLSIVKHIVEAHGGRVMVVSEPGRGSTFTLLIP